MRTHRWRLHLPPSKYIFNLNLRRKEVRSTGMNKIPLGWPQPRPKQDVKLLDLGIISLSRYKPPSGICGGGLLSSPVSRVSCVETRVRLLNAAEGSAVWGDSCVKEQEKTSFPLYGYMRLRDAHPDQVCAAQHKSLTALWSSHLVWEWDERVCLHT